LQLLPRSTSGHMAILWTAFVFLHYILDMTAMFGCKLSPPTTSLCNYSLLALRDHGLYFVYIWKKSSAHVLGGRQCVGIIHYHWWTASIKPRLLFSHAGYAFGGLTLFSVEIILPQPYVFWKKQCTSDATM